ncbi:MAG TPA: Fpg/Nei family DNA glycosylase [Dehalococcoidia bacterium]|nr:Fpg/Nei family DNA glycosylase [Dehalococcoidia bacterium]
MPEAPDLEVIKEFLDANVLGRSVASVSVLKYTVMRSLTDDLSGDLPGRTLERVHRWGKFLLLEFSGDRWLAINPMLTGALQYCQNNQRKLKKTCFVLDIGEGQELRYLDDKQMGKVYYVTEEQMEQVPVLCEQGPDVLSGASFHDFGQRLKKFHGEIKGVLTRGAFVSGVGNAYSDEILFAAGLSPFRKSRSLSESELRRLYESCTRVVLEAMDVLRERVGRDIHIKIRDFLKVHNKGGQPCPDCGGNITQLTANQRITSYCRHCQPGMLIRN